MRVYFAADSEADPAGVQAANKKPPGKLLNVAATIERAQLLFKVACGDPGLLQATMGVPARVCVQGLGTVVLPYFIGHQFG